MTDGNPGEFGDLRVAWLGGSRYSVYSPADDDDRDGGNAYSVNLTDGGSCDCPHGEHNGNTTETCKHVAACIASHLSVPDLEHSIVREFAGTARDAARVKADAEQALHTAEQATVETREAQASAVQADSSSGSQTDSENPSDDTDDSEVAMYDEPENMAQEELVDRLMDWFSQAAEFNGFDADIIELSWADAEGQPGIAVERSPLWDGTYHDGDEWTDKDGFNEAKEAVRDAVLGPNDEFSWYGEPDYCYWVSKEDSLDLTDSGDSDG